MAKRTIDMTGWSPEEIAAGERREPGLFRRGGVWWMRTVRSPSGAAPSKSMSTGESDLRIANAISRMVDQSQSIREMWEWVDGSIRGEISLSDLYKGHSAGTLHLLRQKREEKAALINDVDVEPFVQRWLHGVVHGRDISDHQKDTYENQIRHLIPAGVRFPRSEFTEDTVLAKLNTLKTPTGRTASGSTKRATMNTWTQFFRWAKKRVPLTENPFDGIEKQDRPRRNAPRSTNWEFERVQQVLAAFPEGDRKVAATLIFGAGTELGALLDIQALHIIGGQDRRIIVPGSKTDNRETRTVFVDAWAWPTIVAHVEGKRPMDKLFSDEEMGYLGRRFRETLYEVQVALELIPAPPVNPKTCKKLWGSVEKHDVHDARHTYAMIRLLGLDGAKRESFKYVAHQLGHADEQMVMQIYSKCRGDERLRLIELREAREEGRASQAAAQMGIKVVA